MKSGSRLARSLGLQAILCAVLALAGIFEAGCPVPANAWPTVVVDRMEHPSMPLGCGCADWSCPLPEYCHEYDGLVRLRVYGDFSIFDDPTYMHALCSIQFFKLDDQGKETLVAEYSCWGGTDHFENYAFCPKGNCKCPLATGEGTYHVRLFSTFCDWQSNCVDSLSNAAPLEVVSSCSTCMPSQLPGMSAMSTQKQSSAAATPPLLFPRSPAGSSAEKPSEATLIDLRQLLKPRQPQRTE